MEAKLESLGVQLPSPPQPGGVSGCTVGVQCTVGVYNICYAAYPVSNVVYLACIL